MAPRTVAVTRVSPFSAFKVGLALALVGFVAWLITVIILYLGMSAAGIWESFNSLIGGIGGDQAVTFGLVLAVAALIGAIATILVVILAPLTAVIYNAVSDLFGGLVVETDKLEEE